jgi:SAM-dependent methyltransferase
MAWTRDVVGNLDLKSKSVLEVGSKDENGTVRDLFDTDIYIGVDMRDGPGVDYVCHAHALDVFYDNQFQVVISTEMLEHDAQFWLSLPEMSRVLQPGGYLILTMRGNGFIEHGYPNDYWRFMPNAAEPLLELAGCDRIAVAKDPLPGHPGLFIVGQKR